METVKFVEQCLNAIYERLVGSVKGLSREGLLWRPAQNANCIGELLLHVARAEDHTFRATIGPGPELWESQEWYKRFTSPSQHSIPTDVHIVREAAAPAPLLEDLLAYLKAVHEDAVEKLHSLSATDLDHTPNPELPERPVSSYFRHLITHSNHHHGQMDYIRGLVEPEWSLPRGTGLIQR